MSHINKKRQHGSNNNNKDAFKAPKPPGPGKRPEGKITKEATSSSNTADSALEPWDEGDLQVEFCLESMQDDDYFMMKNMLKGYLMDTSYNSGELCDLMLAQKSEIGSVITVVGQEESFGFMSVIDIAAHWDKPAIQSTIKFVLGKVATSSQVEEWKRILGKPENKVGLIVSERIANLPDHLAPHLNLITLQELAASQKNHKYQYYLLLTNTYKQAQEDEEALALEQDRESGGNNPPSSKRRKLTPAAAPSPSSLDPTVYYYKAEDALYKECSLLSHSSRIVRNNQSNRWTLHMYTQPSKLFLLIAADQLPRITTSLNKMASEVEAELKAKHRS